VTDQVDRAIFARAVAQRAGHHGSAQPDAGHTSPGLHPPAHVTGAASTGAASAVGPSYGSAGAGSADLGPGPAGTGAAPVRRRPLFRLPPAPGLVCDLEGQVLQANAALADLAGVSGPDQFVGASVHAFVLGADHDAALAWPGAGRVTRVRVLRVPLAPAADGTELLMVLLVDVSDLHGVVDELAEERRRMAEVERVAGIGSWEYDPRTGVTSWSQGHYELLDIEPGTVRPGAGAVLDVTHPEDREALEAYWQDHQSSGAGIDIEYRVMRPSGDWRRLQGLAKAQRDATGRLVRFTGSIRDITEQREAEAALAAERARLLEAQRIARMGSWEYDLATDRPYFSAALVEMYRDLDVDPAVDPLAAIHPDDRPALTSQLQELATCESGRTIEVEFRGPPPADTVYVCRARAERTATGETTRVIGTVQDVTEQRAMERQLRDERRRLAEAQRVARTGTWEWDPETDEVLWSEMLYELYDVPTDEELTYQTYLGMVHPSDRGRLDEQCQALTVDGQPMESEHRVVLRDGTQRVFHAHAALVTTPHGRTTVVGSAQDVTEQRAAETRMRRSSQRFADLVSITPVGIGLFDTNEQLVDANDALCQLLGYSLEQLRGMTTESLTHPDDRPGHLPPVTKVLASGQSSYTVPQVVLLRADGEAVYCELHISVSVQDDGQHFWLVVFSDITERRRAAEVLRHQATHDELTGLPNRFAVKQLLGELMAGPTWERVAVLFCDIDNFKRVNDSLGHDAGDELLVALARRLEAGMPDGCMPARLGGDEYLVICSDTSKVGGVDALVATVSELLRTAVGLRGQPVRVSATIGAAVPNGTQAVPEDLLRFADAAMYQAKRAGRGRVALASAALMDSADRQVALEGQLREALAGDGLTLHFQPVVGADGSVLTAEALVRWPHPERGLLAPGAFLPVAEQGDLLRELDRWVLRTALREAAGWPVYDDRPVGVAVNLAGLLPGDPDFVNTVANAVAESGIAYDRVVLELVETALVDLPSRTRSAMAELVERGVRFAVDDFGTGYSSLARLKELPAQIVKMDRQFVSGVGTDPSDFAVARAVVDMARAMNRSCVAEGVETAQQFHVLRGMGVDAYQGWLFSRPVPAPEFRAVIALGPLHIPRTG
jgi:diguanylate cyclase (GGDEF)-like protein/PAS domain S-box-containing protein